LTKIATGNPKDFPTVILTNSSINRAASLGINCVLFIDEIESIAPKRETMDSQHGTHHHYLQTVDTLLTEMNHPGNKSILIIGATNFKHMVDDAVIRRFSSSIHIGNPELEKRRAILQDYSLRYPVEYEFDEKRLLLLNNINNGLQKGYLRREKGLIKYKIDFKKVAEMTEGFNIANLQVLVDKGYRISVEEGSSILDDNHLKKAFRMMRCDAVSDKENFMYI
jgi:SpoVK/Ycf46/Vps4 family AAA+-type ATPase